MNIAVHSFIITIHHIQSFNDCDHSPLPSHVCVGTREPCASACILPTVVRSAMCAQPRDIYAVCVQRDEENQAVGLLIVMLSPQARL